MKKTRFIVLAIVLIALTTLGFKSIGDSGQLPRDGNRESIQVGQSIRMYDSANTNFEHLDENAFTTHVEWDVTNDLDDDSLSVRWTFVDTARSTLTQVNADQLYKLKNNEVCLLTYTIYDSIAADGSGTISAWVTGICDSTAIDIIAGVGKTLAITSGAASVSADFVVTVKAYPGVTAGKFAFDDMYLTTYYGSPLLIPDGESITLTTPTDAITLRIDPIGTEVQVEIGEYSYHIWSGGTLPCIGDEEITVANDSGATATVYFFYNMAVAE